MTCAHYMPATDDGGFCRINARGAGVMVGRSICRMCASYSGPPRMGSATVPVARAGVTPAGLGDLVEKLVKPIARAIKSDCLDERDALKPGSPCAKRRDALNKLYPGSASIPSHSGSAGVSPARAGVPPVHPAEVSS